MKWMFLAVPLLLMVACDQKPADPVKSGDTMKHPGPVLSANQAKDPICNMAVDKEKALKTTYEGTNYYFCADECQKKFNADPKKYATWCVCAKTAKKCDCGHCTPKGETCDCHS